MWPSMARLRPHYCTKQGILTGLRSFARYLLLCLTLQKLQEVVPKHECITPEHSLFDALALALRGDWLQLQSQDLRGAAKKNQGTAPDSQRSVFSHALHTQDVCHNTGLANACLFTEGPEATLLNVTATAAAAEASQPCQVADKVQQPAMTQTIHQQSTGSSNS